jgi:hypothetical protein
MLIHVYCCAAPTCFSTYVPSSGSVFVLESYVKTELCSSEKNCKMDDKGGSVSAKLCAFQCIFCVQGTKYEQKSIVQERPA